MTKTVKGREVSRALDLTFSDLGKTVKRKKGAEGTEKGKKSRSLKENEWEKREARERLSGGGI